MFRAMLLSPPNNYCTTFHVQDSLWCHSIFSFLCMFCRSLFVFWPLCCLSFFDWWILITPLLSSNSSCPLKSNVLACTFFLLTDVCLWIYFFFPWYTSSIKYNKGTYGLLFVLILLRTCQSYNEMRKTYSTTRKLPDQGGNHITK